MFYKSKDVFKKKKRGFTLIELLAVIVILAIIAVIATPIITGIIEDAKKAAFERSVDGIVKGTETDVALKLSSDGYTYTITDGVIDNLDEKIKISNTKGFTGTIKYDSDANVSYAIHNDKWCKSKSGEEVTISEYNGKCDLPKMPFENGYIVYFDVTTGEKCTNYHEDNSLVGYNGLSSTKTTNNQNGCLKFYSFNYEGKEKVNLLLDHNTTAVAYWTEDNIESNTNANGPMEVLTTLKTDTDNWLGTESLDNYTVSQTGYGNYTIPYSDGNYKARLITANEIAKITGNTTFNESTSSTVFYFDTNKTSQSSTCKSGDISGCNYGWLYDRASSFCATYGCLNNSGSHTINEGYWTGTSSFGRTNAAWYVSYAGSIGRSNIDVGSNYGVRPVIEVLKSKLQ